MRDWKEYVRANLRVPTLAAAREAEIIEELAQQLDEAFQEALNAGYSESEAQEQACQHISDWDTLSKEIEQRERARVSCLERWEIRCSARNPSTLFGLWIARMQRDIVFALRILRRSPGFTSLAILMVALGIGVTVASFSVLYTALWKPLPYPHPQELVTVSEVNQKEGVTAGAVSAANFYDWQSRSTSFSAVAAYASWSFNVTGTYEPERVGGALVSPDFFTVFGIQPIQGRLFRPHDDDPGKSNVVVMSERLWTTLFGDSTLGDQEIVLNGTKMQVIGIAPSDFLFPSREAKLWVPLSLAPSDRQNRAGRWLNVVGRLAPGADEAAAQQNMALISNQLEKEYPESNSGWGTRVMSLHEKQFGAFRRPLVLVQAAVVFLFLASCFNIAGLMLARAKAREGEFATRLVLGATRLIMMRQFLVESLILCGAGGILGILLSFVIVGLMRSELAQLVPTLGTITVNREAGALGIALAGISMIFCGMIPTLQSMRPRLPKNPQRGPGRGLRIREALVTGQMAFAIVLAVGALVNLRSFMKLAATNPGFNPQNTLAIDLTLPKLKYKTSQTQTAFLRNLLEQLRTLPAVVSAGVVSDPPLRQNSMSFHVMCEQDQGKQWNRLPQAGVRWVSADYFATMQIPLIRGSAFDSPESSNAPPAAVVNRSLAREFWPGANPIGKRVRLEDDSRWFSIVGVVDDVKQLALSRDEGPALYLAYEQKSAEWLNWATVVVRTSIPPQQLASAIRSKVRELDPEQPISKVVTIEQSIDDEIMLPRFASGVSSSFSGLALILALLGISAVVAFAVNQRSHEIGVRLALGAERHHILRLVMREGARSALTGLVIGLVVSLGVIRVLQTILYGVGSEPVILALVGIASIVLTLIACYVPAATAMRIDPVHALRYE